MPWILRANDFKQSPLPAVAVLCTKKEKVVLSLKKLGFFWGLALVSVFIPVLHFFLVPSFLIAGVVMASGEYKNTHYFALSEPVCPQCKGTFVLKDLYFFDGKKAGCPLCFEQLVLTEAQVSL